MRQIPLPLRAGSGGGPARIVIGSANQAVADALSAPGNWPYRTAVLAGPPRSGKSLFARWFAATCPAADVVDDADSLDETELFHRWNRAQEAGAPLLFVAGSESWKVGLPDLASRLGAALHLRISAPDDEMVAALIDVHAGQCGIVLGEGVLNYLAPRVERSYAAIERLVTAIDALSLERKHPATLAIARDALAAMIETPIIGDERPRLR